MGPCRRWTLGFVLIAWLVAAPGVADAATDCSSLPKSALKPYPCNPQEQCLRLIPKGLEGRALEAARRDCHRQPAQGICHGPETYNPQAACQSEQQKKK